MRIKAEKESILFDELMKTLTISVARAHYHLLLEQEELLSRKKSDYSILEKDYVLIKEIQDYINSIHSNSLTDEGRLGLSEVSFTLAVRPSRAGFFRRCIDAFKYMVGIPLPFPMKNHEYELMSKQQADKSSMIMTLTITTYQNGDEPSVKITSDDYIQS